MAYIGNTATTQAFTPAIDYFSGNGSRTAFTLSRPVASAAQVQAVIENVPQNPGSAFTLSGNTITFTSAPPSGTNNIYVYYTSPITQVNALTQSPSVLGPMYVGINGAGALGGATNPIVGMSGSANNYVQSYVLNQTNGANSSADFTAYPSNGADSAGWVDVGITGPTFSQAAYSVTGPNESYLFGSAPSGSGTTGNLVIATDSTGTSNSIQFYTGGFTQAKSAARMTIDGSGNVAVGTATMTRNFNVVSGVGAATGLNLNNTGTSGRSYSIFSTNNSAAAVGVLGFYDDTAGAYRMVIDGSGNVGIGTSSPAAALDVRKSSGAVYGIIGTSSGGGPGAGLVIAGTQATNKNWVIANQVNVNGLEFTQTTTAGGTTIGSTPSMMLDLSGNLLVGTTSSSIATGAGASGFQYLVGQNLVTAASSYTPLVVNRSEANTTSLELVAFFRNGAKGGTITGTPTATAYNTSSDYRLKHDIQPMTGALAKVTALKPVTYKWNTDNSEGEGFIAHELQEVVPGCVTGEKDAVDADGNPVYQGIDTSFLVATLTAAIQEQQALIESLTARIEALENK